MSKMCLTSSEFSMRGVDKRGALSLGFRRYFLLFHQSFEFAAGGVAFCPFTDPCPLSEGRRRRTPMGMSSGAVYTYIHPYMNIISVRISVLAEDAISSTCGGDGLFPLSSESRALDRPSNLWWIPLFLRPPTTTQERKSRTNVRLFRPTSGFVVKNVGFMRCNLAFRPILLIY